MQRTRFALLLLAVTLPLFGQDYATLTGTVADSSGALVPNARLEVRNEATGVANTTTSNEQGSFRVPYLQPGSYTVSCEASGFKKFLRQSVLLVAGQSGFIPISMEVGSATEQITVTAEAPLLEATKADRGTVLDNRRITEIPMTTRNTVMLATLVTGVTFRGGSIEAFANGSTAEWQVNGSPSRKNEFQMDGVPNNAMAGSNNIAMMPSVDSIQELRVHTNSYDAEYGKTAGGIISFTTKSGTNEFHGSGYEFAKRTDWQANSFANNRVGAARTPVDVNQYGFVAGGPVYIPKLYNGRNRTFFMFNFERYYELKPWTVQVSVPAPEFLQGDFSRLADAIGRQIAIFDPASGRDVNGTWVRDQFPGNKIPQARIDPIAQKILSNFAKPTRDAAPFAGYSVNNYYEAATNIYPYYAPVLKFDHNFTDRHRAFFRWAKSNWKATNWNGGNGLHGEPGSSAQYIWRTNDAYAVDYVGTLTPRLILNVRASYNQFIEANNQVPGNFGFDPAKFGIPAATVQQFSNPSYFGTHSFSGYANLGQNGYVNLTNNWSLHPQVSLVRSSHSIKTGMDIRLIQYNNSASPNTWGYNAGAGFTQRDYLRGDALSGNSIASFLIGAIGGSTSFNAQNYYSIPYYAPYVQDDWRVNRKLTLNLGLRFDFNLAPRERYNRLNRGFNAAAVNPADAAVNHKVFSDLPQLMGGMLFAGVNGVPRRTFDTTYGNVQPRIGVAYQVSEKLVMRGGWGRYFINPDNQSFITAGFSRGTSITSSIDGNRTPVAGLTSNPFPNGVLLPVGSSLGLLTNIGGGFNYVNSSFKLPHADQFTLGFQYSLPIKSVIDISYSGNRTHDVQTEIGVNEPSLAVRQKCNLAEGGTPSYCDANLPNPFAGLAPFAGTSFYSAAVQSRFQLSRPYPQFGGLTQVMGNAASTWYNGLQVSWETRQFKSLNILVNYAFSKMMMTGYSQWYLGDAADFLDTQRKVLAHGIYSGDMTHQFKAAAVYDLPFGKGKRWLASSNPVASRVFGGWQLSTVMRWNSGMPQSLPGNVFYVKEAKVDNIDLSAQLVRGWTPCVSKWNDDGSITMLAYSVNLGCKEANWIVEPRYAPRATPYFDSRFRLHTTPYLDAALAKSTRLWERINVQFRLEAFNATNTQNSAGGGYNTNPEDPNFGTMARTGGAVGARTVQLGMKLNW